MYVYVYPLSAHRLLFPAKMEGFTDDYTCIPHLRSYRFEAHY